jgi:uncharacterized RDD family membrane protein YckC
MTCPNCAKQISNERMFCTWCDAYVPDPGTGEKASIARRLAAALIDPALYLLAFFAPMWLLVGIFGDTFGTILGFFTFIGVVIMSFVLFARGQTFGKFLLNQQVVDRRTGMNPGILKMVVREWIGKWVSGFFFGLGFIWAIFDKDTQAWHDKIASTVVVKRRTASELAAAPIRPALG